ncbi:MAG: HD-GYP domain-containing protein [Psychrobacillus sp.]|uniref:HD-GYP domain-containing protein n=1 Tax=Psychrobacillus sp. MER TA 171 TaxID=2939577 RepID=UPI00203D40B2|nr:HD-GYP domain-containing protein [Psychrobacillus sp. MER TA 171]MCM3357546.1 HD-GYP domain-containing protein [Psychrobacillus sp. MER TA 171]
MILTKEQIHDIREKQSLPRVVTDKTITTYIGSSDDISYALYTLTPASTTWIYSNPCNESNYVEKYYIIAGSLKIVYWNEHKILRPGDLLDLVMLNTLITCHAKEEVHILIEMTKKYFTQNFLERGIIHRDALRIQEVDGYTYHHCARIRDYSIELWKRLNPNKVGVRRLFLGSYFHDIGKLAIPIEILNKPGKLTEDEWKIVKMHTTLGAEMMRNHEISCIREAAFIVEQHHERYDGKGYPFGLMGEEISLEASIVSVVDAFDAMTTNRVYRGAMTFEEAILEIKRGRGTQFNPKVLDEFLEMLQEKNNQW